MVVSVLKTDGTKEHFNEERRILFGPLYAYRASSERKIAQHTMMSRYIKSNV